LPVSTPCASGDQTICEIPCSRRAGSPRPPARQSAEYCGWLETNFATPGQLERLAICSAGHSLKPDPAALPASTTSVSACIVSSSGVSSS
jgi:hypothetical protein